MAARDEPADRGGADPVIGQLVLGKYRVDRRLGRGGMGAVYRVTHVELPGTHAALKILDVAGDAGASSRERFRQEALVAATVGSHRVVRPLDIGELADGTPYILMELVEGRSLAEELAARGPLPVVEALRVATRVADTMAIAHDRAIVHRDLKPPNVMLARQGEDLAVKLLDFGVARASGEIKVARTAENVVVGTPGYMSPEAVAGAIVDGRTDVFSLGVMLFEMLAGRLPFAAETVPQAMLSVLGAEPAPKVGAARPPGLDPVPPAVERIVARALEKDLADRPVMTALRDELRAALASLDAAAPATPLPSMERPRTVPLDEAPTLSASPAPALIPPLASAQIERALHGEPPPPESAADAPAARRAGVRLAIAVAVLLLAVAGVVTALTRGARSGAADHARAHEPIPIEEQPPAPAAAPTGAIASPPDAPAAPPAPSPTAAPARPDRRRPSAARPAAPTPRPAPLDEGGLKPEME